MSFHFVSFQRAPKYFWILLFVFSLTSAIVLYDSFRVYSGETALLVIRHGGKDALPDETLENIATIPETLDFYNRLLTQFPEVKDPWAELGNGARRALWRERISVEREDDGSMLRLSVVANTESDARALAEKSSIVLFQTIGRYYDIRNDIDIRTIDAPIVSARIEHPLGWGIASLGSGFALAAAISLLLAAFARRSREAKQSEETAISSAVFPALTSSPKLSEKELIPVTFATPFAENETSSHATKREATPIETSAQQTPAQTEVKLQNTAPELPFLEEGVSLEEYLFGSAIKQSSETAETAPAHSDESETKRESDAILETEEVAPGSSADESPIRISEPTPEELKRRLNMLLRGEL